MTHTATLTTNTARFDFQKHVLNFDGYATVKWDDPEETPLDIDIVTAALLAQVHDTLKPANQENLIAMCNQAKWRFCHLVEKAWTLVK